MKDFSAQVVPNKLSDRVLQAMQLIPSKGEQEAHNFIVRSKDEALEQFGDQSLQYAEALNDAGTFFKMRGVLETAEQFLRMSSEIPATHMTGVQVKLDSLQKLGRVLTKLGKLEESETILRSSLREIHEVYGPESSQFALGLEAVARTLFQMENYTHAEALATQSVDILVNQRDPETFRTLVFRDLCTKAVHGTGKQVFQEYPELHHVARTSMFEIATGLAKTSKPEFTIPYLFDLRNAIIKAGDTSAFNLVVISSVMSYQARRMGDNRTRISVLEWTLNRPEVQTQQRLKAIAFVELAHAHADNGDFKEAESAYLAAAAATKMVGPETMVVTIYRNYAVLMTKMRETKKATKLFQKALAQANKIGDTVGLGRTQIASGIAYQHLGDFDSTKIMIDEGLKNLTQHHQDKLSGFAHNAAAAEKMSSCPCGDLDKTVLYAAKGILLYLGLKLEMFEVNLSPSEYDYPSIDIKLVHRKIPEDKIPKAESIVAYCKRELPHLIKSHFQYNPM